MDVSDDLVTGFAELMDGRSEAETSVGHESLHGGDGPTVLEVLEDLSRDGLNLLGGLSFNQSEPAHVVGHTVTLEKHVIGEIVEALDLIGLTKGQAPIDRPQTVRVLDFVTNLEIAHSVLLS